MAAADALAATNPRSQAMQHDDWMQAATEEYGRLVELLAGLSPEEWSRPTACTGWDVRALVAHLVGAGEASASLRELIRQQRAGKRVLPDADDVDAMNEVQVRERADRTPAQLTGDLAQAGVRSVRARRRLPAPLRALRVPLGPPLGVRPIGYLMDRIYTRDAWMHRMDVCAATGRQPLLTPQHDGRIVDDVVDEWARTHGRPFQLHLTGPAGGTWSSGTGGEALELDAVEFCRVLSGRGTASGLLETRVQF